MSEPAEVRGRIHDARYEPYRGPRRPVSRRFWVISKNVVALAWRQRGPKGLVILSGLATAVTGGVMIVADLVQKAARGLSAGGELIPRADALIFLSYEYYVFVGFLLSTLIGCATVADDLKLGSFQFYFARPIRPRDYVAGKLLGIFLLAAIPAAGGPIVLAILRLFLASDFPEALRLSPLLLKMLVLGAFGAVAVGLPAAAAGALMQNKRAAWALYAIYYVVGAEIAEEAASHMNIPELHLLSLSANLENIARWLLGIDRAGRMEIRTLPHEALSLAVVVLMGVASFLLVRWRVKSAENMSLGGSS